jgi:probable F420-dependent oxidoreductase
MRLDVLMFPTDKAIQPVQLAKEVEARGFASLWFPEHSHIPTSRRTPWGGPQRKEAPPLPEEYWRSHDQFVALAAAAAVTTRLQVGTGICLVAQHDPLWLAKQVASLDVISGGRFLFGIGVGWNVEEMANHGIDFGTRRARARENVLAMKELWTKEEAAFSGEFVDFEPSWAWPKPQQQPHPPVWLGGGAGPKVFEAVVDYADGWMPNRHPAPEHVEQLHRAAEAAGRDPASIRLGMFGAKADAQYLDELAERGFEWAALGLPPAEPDKVLGLLDRYQPLAERFASA